MGDGAGLAADGGRPPDWRVGQAVTVRYRPESPHQAEIESFLALWGLALICGGLAAVFLGLGLGLLLGLVPL